MSIENQVVDDPAKQQRARERCRHPDNDQLSLDPLGARRPTK